MERKIKNQKSKFKLLVKLIVLMLVVWSAASDVFAQKVSRVGTTAAPFLKIGIGARALAMGEAMVTEAIDATALYWNPAGLGWVQKNQVLLCHYDYIADLNFEYGGVVIVLPSIGALGASFTYLGAPDIERTTEDFQDGSGEMVSASFYNFAVSYGRSLTNRFSIGGSAKYIQENLWHTSASSFALDVGVLYRTNFNNLRIGMSISNFGSSMRLDGRDLIIQHDIDPNNDGNNGTINARLETDAFPLPILFRFGMSANLARDFLGLSNQDFILAVNALHPNDNKEYLNIGGEYRYRDFIALRGGYRQLLLDDAEGGLTFGFGLNLPIQSFNITLDYAAVDYGRLDYVNKFSFIFSF